MAEENKDNLINSDNNIGRNSGNKVSIYRIDHFIEVSLVRGDF